MKFKGREFIVSKDIVKMELMDEDGNVQPYAQGISPGYVIFGKVTKLGAKKKGAYKTKYTFAESGEPVYAVPIEAKGYSLTNMMYGKDGYTYLMLDGRCYKTKEKKKEEIKDFSFPSKYKI